MSETFKVGDVVRLKSGSPRLVINAMLYRAGFCRVAWISYSDSKPQEMEVSLECIRHG